MRRARWHSFALLVGLPFVALAMAGPGSIEMLDREPTADTIATMPTDDLIERLSLSRERGPIGPPLFTWADAEFVRRLDANTVSWGQLAHAMERMRVMRAEPSYPEGAEVKVWMRLPAWWRSVELTASSLPDYSRVLRCDTRQHSCGAASDGQEREEARQNLGTFPPGRHEVRFQAHFHSIYWLADAREEWNPTFVLRFDVAPELQP